MSLESHGVVVRASVLTLLLGACTGNVEGGGSDGRTGYDELSSGPAGLRGLTPAQYEASVRDALGLGAAGSDDAPIRPLGQWSTAIAAARGGFSPTTVAEYETGARDAAMWLVADEARRMRLVGCTPSSIAGDACTSGFLGRVGRRAYRRPLTAAELARWTSLASTLGTSLGDPWAGLAHALSGILQSPSFLYRVELAEDDPESDDPAQLRYTSLEMATRLSYLVWGTSPDDALLDAAEDGSLLTDDGLDAAIDRLLDDDRAEAGLAAFVADLFEVDGLDQLEWDPLLHPEFGALRAPMRAQVVLTGTRALTDGGFRALFTTRTTFVNAALAPTMGMSPASFGDRLVGVELDAADPRAGMLTMPGFLALHAYPGKTSPALRGLYVRRRLLCGDIPPPPPGVDTVLPEMAEGRLVTTRELLGAHQSVRTCAACHRYMDPIGLGLENFDEVGVFRATQNDLPIDPSGVIDGLAFDDAAGLGEAIASHPSLGPCMASRVYAFAAGATVPADHAQMWEIGRASGDVRAMLRALVSSDLFRRASAAPETSP